MRWLACALLLGVFVRHDTAFTMAAWIGTSPGVVFYVLGALWEVMLCTTLLGILWAAKRDAWTEIAMAAVTIGIVEAGMVAGCQIALHGAVPPGMTTCQHVTGIPIGAVVTTLEASTLLALVGWHIAKWWAPREE
jgi:hypothetical protein